MISKKRILVAPLNWGLGHATRCIQVIKKLLEANAEVIIAADKGPLELLRGEFPEIEFVVLPGYTISYPRNANMVLKMLWQAPRLLSAIKREHEQLEEIIKEKNIDAVISDNRYGLYTNKVPCIFITHQLNIKSPIGERMINKLNRRYINKYTECWAPDFEGKDNLSGELSHGKNNLKTPVYFIGPLSRFFKPQNPVGKKYDVLVVLSGPEPQRSMLEEIILRELNDTFLKCLIVRGIPGKQETKKINENVEMISHLSAAELNNVIPSSEIIISRPGYSTIMDLAALGKKAIFIPTPGQTEQEYLAKKMREEKIAPCFSQDKFNLKAALKAANNYTGFNVAENDWKILKEKIEILLKRTRRKEK